MRTIGTIKGNDIIEQDDGSVTFFAGATLNGNGANGQFGGSPCYAPSSYNGPTLNVIGNAGHPGNWLGVITDNGEITGTPIMQKAGDPCVGAYVSATSLHLPGKDGKALPASSPYKYVDSATIPFIVVPPMIIHGVVGIVMGCRAVVTNSETGQTTEAVVAGGGPKNHLGEISVACARAIGVPTGGTQAANGGGAASPTIKYQLFPGKAAVVNGVTYPLQQI
jgi:hypothetical protein